VIISKLDLCSYALLPDHASIATKLASTYKPQGQNDIYFIRILIVPPFPFSSSYSSSSSFSTLSWKCHQMVGKHLTIIAPYYYLLDFYLLIVDTCNIQSTSTMPFGWNDIYFIILLTAFLISFFFFFLFRPSIFLLLPRLAFNHCADYLHLAVSKNLTFGSEWLLLFSLSMFLTSFYPVSFASLFFFFFFSFFFIIIFFFSFLFFFFSFFFFSSSFSFLLFF
jgi:hypothetical protein